MSPAASAPLLLICGDEFVVKGRAKEVFQRWCAELGGLDHEIIDGSVAHSAEALKVLSRLREALQTLPFFGGAKAIWLQNCTFLGDERAASAQAVTEDLAELAQQLKTFPWTGVRLLVSAGKVDKRKSFFKAIEKLGTVENFAGWSVDDRDWADQAETWVRQRLIESTKQISDEAAAAIVAQVGPNSRLLASETDKLITYAGAREKIDLRDVESIVTRNKHARAFALGDALGDRDLPRVLRCLSEEVWEMKSDSQKSEIGLLYGLITKVRVLLFLKEMLRLGYIKVERDFNRFKAQLQRVPTEALPADKRFSPLAMNPYVLFKGAGQAGRYSEDELIRAMELLLRCNQRLIFSSLDEVTVLQQTLVEIVGSPTPGRADHLD